MEYLNGKTWGQITREERLFCAELYNELKIDKKPFLDKYHFNSSQKYEIGYEVCFYRDVLKEYELKGFGELFNQKRTFDLVLFSNNEIHIFEAKSQQGFNSNQLNKFNDVEKIKELFEKINQEKNINLIIPKIKLWAIISTMYKPKEETRNIFENNIVYWRDIYNLYKNELFKRANEIYNN